MCRNLAWGGGGGVYHPKLLFWRSLWALFFSLEHFFCIFWFMLSWGCNHHDRWQTILSPLQQIIIKLDVLFSVLAVFSSIINVIIVIIFWMKFFNWYINNKVNNLFYRLSKIIHSFTNDSCKIFSWNQAIIFEHPFRLNAIALCFEMIQGVEKNAFFSNSSQPQR